jgi:regulatory protein
MRRQITDIQVQKNNPSRYSIFLDGKFFCGIDKGVVEKFQLKLGMEMDEEKLKELIYEAELSKAKSYVYRILGKRMYTCKEVKDKLVERGYLDEIVQDVIATLERYGYLNDKNYAEEWIQSRLRSNPKGKYVLRQELARKGIEDSIIVDALGQEFDESKEQDMALELAQRKIKLYKNDDPASARRKLQGVLFRRGFNSEMINAVIEQVMGEESEEQRMSEP